MVQQRFVALDQHRSAGWIEIHGLWSIRWTLKRLGIERIGPHEVQYESIDDQRTELFQKIEREGWTARIRNMEGAKIRIEAGHLNRRQHIVECQRVAERQQCVDRIGRRVKGAPPKPHAGGNDTRQAPKYAAAAAPSYPRTLSIVVACSNA